MQSFIGWAIHKANAKLVDQTAQGTPQQYLGSGGTVCTSLWSCVLRCHVVAGSVNAKLHVDRAAVLALRFSYVAFHAPDVGGSLQEVKLKDMPEDWLPKSKETDALAVELHRLREKGVRNPFVYLECSKFAPPWADSGVFWHKWFVCGACRKFGAGTTDTDGPD